MTFGHKGLIIKKEGLDNEEKIQELLGNEGIIRNRLKVAAAVTNAKAFLDIQGSGIWNDSSFSMWIDSLRNSD